MGSGSPLIRDISVCIFSVFATLTNERLSACEMELVMDRVMLVIGLASTAGQSVPARDQRPSVPGLRRSS